MQLLPVFVAIVLMIVLYCEPRCTSKPMPSTDVKLLPESVLYELLYKLMPSLYADADELEMVL